MSDWSEQGAVPVEDAAVDDPPTVDEVLEKQRERDDLPAPSDDPDHQQVEQPDIQRNLDDQAVANNTPPNARCDADADTAGD